MRPCVWQIAPLQGITPEQEAEAERALGCREVINGVTVVRMSHSKTATVADRLFDPEKEQRLLILSGDGESNFFGKKELCLLLQGEKTGRRPKVGIHIPISAVGPEAVRQPVSGVAMPTRMKS